MISIIIPALNEESSIEDILIQINNLPGYKEIIVVDGGSCDRTVEIASKYSKVIHSKKGRANQMNKGANASHGDILWFLHSDSIIDMKSLKNIEKAIEEGYIGGGFSLYFHDFNTLFMKFVALTSNWRARFLGLYYGDQGIFIRRDIFYRTKGFKNIEIMEDWELSRRLKKTFKMKMLDISIGTSGRRFKNNGQLKTILLMHKIKLLYILGVSPSRLIRYYREAR